MWKGRLGRKRSKNWGMHLVPSIYWCYDPVQYYLRTKVSHKFYLHETIYSRRYQVIKYLISKVYKTGYNKSFLLQGIKFYKTGCNKSFLLQGIKFYKTRCNKSFLLQGIKFYKTGCNKSFLLQGIKFYKTRCNKSFLLQGINFLLANEFLRLILLLILQKLISENKSVINT